jgi:hypothetical protein
MFETHHLLPDVKDDVLAISSTDTRFNVQLSSADLLSCHRVNQIFMCDSFGVMSRQFNNTCLGALYMQQFEAAQTLCPFKVVPVEERVYQLCKGHFLAYLPGYTTVNIRCRDGPSSFTSRPDAKARSLITWSPPTGPSGSMTALSITNGTGTPSRSCRPEKWN